MADFEERNLKISFDELNESLKNCIETLIRLKNRKVNEHHKIKSSYHWASSVKGLKKIVKEYSQLRNDFQKQSFCYDENLCGHFDREAAENTRLRKEALIEIDRILFLLKTLIKDVVKDKKQFVDVIWEFKNQVELTMPFKIYALSTFSSALPYSVPEEELSKSSYEKDPDKKEIKWHFVGFAENNFEAWYYVQHDTYAGVNPEMGCEPVRHLLCEPSDEYYNDFVKIESEYYTEYFDLYASKPIGQRYGYRKSEPVCFFCGNKFEGHGCDIYPLQYFFEQNFGYNRACDECYVKFVQPFKQWHWPRMSEKEKKERDTKIEELRVKYLLEKPKFEETETDFLKKSVKS